MDEFKNICNGCTAGEEQVHSGPAPEEGCHGTHRHQGHRGGPCGRKGRMAHYAAMDIDEKLFFMLGKLGRMSHGAHGGKDSQNRVLHMLLRSGGMTQRELTERLDIRPGSASELIKKLESAGLITREANDEDRRTVNISLTEAGKAQVEENRKRFKDTNRALFETLSDEEKAQLLALLEKLAHDWAQRFRAEGHHRGHHKHCHEPESENR